MVVKNKRIWAHLALRPVRFQDYFCERRQSPKCCWQRHFEMNFSRHRRGERHKTLTNGRREVRRAKTQSCRRSPYLIARWELDRKIDPAQDYSKKLWNSNRIYGRLRWLETYDYVLQPTNSTLLRAILMLWALSSCVKSPFIEQVICLCRCLFILKVAFNLFLFVLYIFSAKSHYLHYQREC